LKLLIDAGNSRIKWGVHDGVRWCEQGTVEHARIAQLAQAWAVWPITSVYASLVASEAIRFALQSVSAWPIRWIEALSNGFGVCNHYQDPRQMGADRWLAVLAARRLAAQDVVVVCAGTALTIESLCQSGDYLGGLILPGFHVMLHSLGQATARLDQPAGNKVDFPQTTADALASGVVEAQVGAIERARTRLASHTGGALLLVMVTGGDAERIAPWLASPVRIVDNLVLMGLLEVANES